MYESDLHLPRHLDKLKGQAPRPFLRYAQEETEAMSVVAFPARQQIKRENPLLFLLPIFLLCLILGNSLIWLLPVPFDWVYRLVLSILLALLCYAGMRRIEGVLTRWNTPTHLLTQQVPIVRDPLRVMTQDLTEETQIYLERIRQ